MTIPPPSGRPTAGAGRPGRVLHQTAPAPNAVASTLTNHLTNRYGRLGHGHDASRDILWKGLLDSCGSSASVPDVAAVPDLLEYAGPNHPTRGFCSAGVWTSVSGTAWRRGVGLIRSVSGDWTDRSGPSTRGAIVIRIGGRRRRRLPAIKPCGRHVRKARPSNGDRLPGPNRET